VNILHSGSKKVEQEQLAQANNSIPATAHEMNGAGSGEADEKTLLFSKELATKINPKRPDITASIIIYGLYLWQKTKVEPFRYVPMVNGQRGSYRSLSDLREEFPWLTEEGIRKAVWRAEKALKGAFIVDDENPEAERSKLHYWISPKLIEKYRFAKKRKGLLQVKAGDVLKFGMMEAVLISNLAYVTDEARNSEPVTDDEGRIYRELSPTTLTEEREDLDGNMKSILPCKRNKVSEALAHLLAEGVMFEHPKEKGFYRLKTASESVSKVADDVSKVASGVSKVASGVSKVARRNEGMPLKPCVDEALRAFPKTSDTNTCSNADSNLVTKCILHHTAELRSPVWCSSSQMSAGAKKLIQLVDDGLAAYRQKPVGKGRIVQDKIHEDFYGPVFDKSIVNGGWHAHLPYDLVGVDIESGKPYSRKSEIKQAIKDIKSSLIEFPFSAQEAKQLEELFIAHPQLGAEHIFELLAFLNPQSGNRCLGNIDRPDIGHDCFYWARRIRCMKTFLRYLPRLAREFYEYGEYWEGAVLDHFVYENGKPVFEYRNMPEPYFSMAFCEDASTPIYITSERNEDDEWIDRPVYYAEYMKLPTVDVAEHEWNPIREAA